MYIPVELLALGIIRYWSFVRVIAQLSELLLDYGTIRDDDSRPGPSREVPNVVCFSWRSEGHSFPNIWEDEKTPKNVIKKRTAASFAFCSSISLAFRAACGVVDVSKNKHTKQRFPQHSSPLSLSLFLSLWVFLHTRASSSSSSSSSSFKRRREDDDDRFVFVFVFVCGGME